MSSFLSSFSKSGAAATTATTTTSTSRSRRSRRQAQEDSPPEEEGEELDVLLASPSSSSLLLNSPTQQSHLRVSPPSYQQEEDDDDDDKDDDDDDDELDVFRLDNANDDEDDDDDDNTGEEEDGDDTDGGEDDAVAAAEEENDGTNDYGSDDVVDEEYQEGNDQHYIVEERQLPAQHHHQQQPEPPPPPPPPQLTTIDPNHPGSANSATAAAVAAVTARIIADKQNKKRNAELEPPPPPPPLSSSSSSVDPRLRHRPSEDTSPVTTPTATVIKSTRLVPPTQQNQQQQQQQHLQSQSQSHARSSSRTRQSSLQREPSASSIRSRRASSDHVYYAQRAEQQIPQQHHLRSSPRATTSPYSSYNTSRPSATSSSSSSRPSFSPQQHPRPTAIHISHRSSSQPSPHVSQSPRQAHYRQRYASPRSSPRASPNTTLRHIRHGSNGSNGRSRSWQEDEEKNHHHYAGSNNSRSITPRSSNNSRWLLSPSSAARRSTSRSMQPPPPPLNMPYDDDDDDDKAVSGEYHLPLSASSLKAFCSRGERERERERSRTAPRASRTTTTTTAATMPTSSQDDPLVAAVNAASRNRHRHDSARNVTSIFVPTADAIAALNLASSASFETTSTNHPIPFAASSTNKHHHHHHRTHSQSSQQTPPQRQRSEQRVPFLEALASVEIPSWLLTDEGVPVVLVSSNGKTHLLQLSISKDKFTVKLRVPAVAAAAMNNNGTTAGGGSTISATAAATATTSGTAALVLRSIDVGEMDRVQRGQSTQQFETAKKKRIMGERGDSSRRINILSNESNSSFEAIFTNPVVMHSNNQNVSFTSIITASSASSSSLNSALLSASGTESNASILLYSLDPERSFSIIFRGAETLDLMAIHRRARDDICNALDRILAAFTRAKVRVAADVRLLRFVWLNVVDPDQPYLPAGGNDKNSNNPLGSNNNSNNDKNNNSTSLISRWSGGGNKDKNNKDSSNNNNNNNNDTDDHELAADHLVNVNQIARQVFPQINFFMKPKDVQSNYEKYGRVIGLDRRRRRRGLTFDQLADFLHYIRRNSWVVKPVTALWNGLFGEFMNNGKPRETVSAQTFLDKFLHQKQGQLDATLPQVYDLFERLHDMEIAHTSTTTTPTSTTTTTTTPTDFLASSHNSNHGKSSKHQQQPSGEPTTVYNRITKDQFEAYLLATENDAFAPEKEALDLATMGKPLSEYFINSSHNTYLIGDQYTSQSRVEMYSNALYRGCRCLELDIWDGGKSPGDNTPIPVVWHGHTMTTKIFFVDIIRTIKVFLNFHPDTFPIILSFENHCSFPYQQVMARQLERILGSALYIPTEASLNSPLPSPEQLRGMVVIKGRRPIYDRNNGFDIIKDSETDYGDSDDDSDVDDGNNTNGTGGGGASGSAGQGSTGTPSISESTATAATATATTPIATITRRERRARHGITPELARLTLLHGTKFKKSWPDSIKSPYYHMHSFSENKVRSLARRPGPSSNNSSNNINNTSVGGMNSGSGMNNNGTMVSNGVGGGMAGGVLSPSSQPQRDDWVVYNQTHMSRTYPAGSRVDSSNYNPILAWALGCQMVALNFQTEDAFLRLNDGRFRENGNCGYVLKPSSLMVPKHELKLGVPVRLTIQVLSGSCLPKPKGRRTGDCIDPYVRLSVFDVNADGKETVSDYSTSVVKCNGFFPVFARHATAGGGGGGGGGGTSTSGNHAPMIVTSSSSSLDYGGASNTAAFEFVVETWAAAILQITVYDKSGKKNKTLGGGEGGEFVASCSIPISCLRQGIRSVKLYDATNTRSGAFDFASLLLDIGMTQVIAEI
ncbi:hypothetical protein ACA910_019694 [Epithemia clementina (nom. ined.)]